MGLFYTKLTTVDNKLILIPNGSLSNGSLVNYSAKEKERVDLTFSVSYENDVNHVKDVLIDVVNKQNFILSDPSYL
ncbi:mechanosensitive ion channel family protein [Paraclostridium bifermentans]|nr:mechanosensitive ion channel family protein [Paraclostridium bifermentans]